MSLVVYLSQRSPEVIKYLALLIVLLPHVRKYSYTTLTAARSNMMYNEDDELVSNVQEILEDLGISSIDEAPYEVLEQIDTDGYINIDDLTDFADRIYG